MKAIVLKAISGDPAYLIKHLYDNVLAGPDLHNVAERRLRSKNTRPPSLPITDLLDAKCILPSLRAPLAYYPKVLGRSALSN